MSKERFPQVAQKREENSLESQEHNKHLVSVFPQGEALLAAYQKAREGQEASIEVMREVLYTMIDKAIENSKLFRSGSSRAEFPYTSIGLREVAETVFTARGGVLSRPEATRTPEELRVIRQYLITSFPPTPTTGGQLEWTELSMHEIVKALPQALTDLEEGREPKDLRVYTLGFPTNEFGLMTDEFEKQVKKDAVGAVGALHAEFIEEETKREHLASGDTIRITGVSLGSSIAAEEAKGLLDAKVTTQATEDTKLPRLSVAMYVPVVDKALRASDSFGSKARVAAGFIAEGVKAALSNPNARMIEKLREPFMEEVRALLKDRMPVRLDDEQKGKKQTGIKALAKQSIIGTSVPEGVKITEIVGLDDLHLRTREWRQEAVAQHEAHPDSLGEHLLERPAPDARLFGINMSHIMPFSRDNEHARFDRVAEAISAISRHH